MPLGYFKKKLVAIPLSLVLLLVVGIGAAKILVSKRWCAASWGRPFHLTQGNIAFPDAYGAYWVRFLSASRTSKQIGFKNPGQIAHGPYESFVACVPADHGMAAQALLDPDMVPDAASPK